MSLSNQNKNILFILFCLLLLYIAWGTSFFFTKLGLAYVPGVLLGGVRATISGILLFLLGIFTQGYYTITLNDFKYATILAVFQVFFSSALLAKGQETITSGLAALLCGTIPLLMVLGEWLLWGGKRPKLKHFIGLGVGLTAILSINISTLFNGHISPVGLALAVCAVLAWVFSGHYSKICCQSNSLYIFQSTGLILFIGGLESLGFGFLIGERWDLSLFDFNGFLILSFLVLMTSIVGYTTYLWLLYHVRPAVALSYEYVNPVIALVLGAAYLGEELTFYHVIACIALLGSVFLVSSYGKE
ncbi:MAG: EamA family transporter [Mailhella sp.]|nr:EamA family transporter [Mailhella sp.]